MHRRNRRALDAMADPSSVQQALVEINASAAFNRWAGFGVTCGVVGEIELSLVWREEFGQYAGFLHAGMVGAMIDTACGFAAYTLAGRVLASHFAVNCLAPAIGESFVARARVVKAGRRQVFTAAELFAQRGDAERLVATGQTILVPVEAIPALARAA
jgi:uncharacterized protein (TIGR00369 family)